MSHNTIRIIATEHSVNSFKNGINSLLKALGSDKKVDDLFTVKLNYVIRASFTDNELQYFDTAQERDEFIDENDTDEESYLAWEDILIEPKDRSNSQLINAASELSRYLYSSDTIEDED